MPAVKTTAPDPKQSARHAGLRYVSDTTPGITRHRAGKGFAYRQPNGKPVRDRATLARIKSLAIPPAWTEVWICPSPHGHIQATGRDARHRKQHRYHPDYRAVREQTKFDRMIEFAHALPAIRRAVHRHLKQKGLPREKVLAAVVSLLESTLIRVGNEQYARDNDSYGLTTLQDDHVAVRGRRVRFDFVGKSGVDRQIDLHDPRLAKIVQQCQDLPGEDLFQYVDEDGKVVDVTSADVNDYLRELTGRDFTAKDFRTWAGTVLAAMALREFEAFDSQTQAKQNVLRAIESVSEQLGNTRAVCRKCYIHPQVIETYLTEGTLDTIRQRADRKLKQLNKLKPEEAAVVTLLRRKLTPAKQRRGRGRTHRRGGEVAEN
ncbi:MAG TPA: DNA topoisomerase IB [Tepidisphaeraceae bacterium]|nr:DNA topoisomerase IB [Tepidisphaeraceae bacterium]